MCVDPITNLSGQPDATSVILKWPPYTGTQSIEKYTVKRNNQVVGSTICKLGYFSDFGLRPGNSYQYRVQGFNANGDLICESGLLEIQTTAETEIRTQYTLLAIVFDPTGEVQAQMPRIENFLKYRLDFLRNASHNSVNLSLYESRIVTLQSHPPVLPENNREISYDKLAVTVYPELNNMSMVDLVESYKADIVWLIGAPEIYNFAENVLMGNHDLGDKEWISTKIPCSRSFFIHQNGPDARAYDAAAHHIEGTMTSASSKDPIAWPRDKEYVVFTKDRFSTLTYLQNLHLFEVFRITDEWNGGTSASKGNANCGSSHFVPGSIRNSQKYDNYTYYDIDAWKRYVPCFADNWLNYPIFSNQPRILNGYDHGAFNRYIENTDSSFFWFGSASFHYWWFNHIPHNPGVYEGKLHNWWPYIYDCNRFDGSFIDYPVSGFPIMPNRYAVTEEVGTESSSPDLWMFWHSATNYGQRADISIVDKNTSPNLVKEGQYSLKTSVQIEWFTREGQNDLIYPRYRNANWSFAENEAISFSIKTDQLGLIQGTNPIVRICTNGNNRIEYVPVKNGRYVNVFQNTEYIVEIENGWYNFTIPIKGNEIWQKNLIAYINPALDEAQKEAEREAIYQNILSQVNYLEISIECGGNKDEVFTYYLDNLRVSPYSEPTPVIIENLTLQPDVTSVILQWTPYTGSPAAKSYRVKRDGKDIGSTIGRYGYFTDHGLMPATEYQYIVEGLDADGNIVCYSLSQSVQTTSETEIRTHYTLLAIVFDPTGELHSQMVRIDNFLKYRLEFLRNASHNSVNLSLYQDKIFTIRDYPPLPDEPSEWISYEKLAAKIYPELNSMNMVDMIEKYDVDVIWVIGTPTGYNFGENILMGNHDLGDKEWISTKVPCSRSFFIHSNTPDARAYDAAAHHIEGTMTSAASKDPIAWPRDREYMVFTKDRLNTSTYLQNLHLFEIFRLTDEWTGIGAYASKGNANCGSSHFIPGSIRNSLTFDDYTFKDIEAWKRYVPCFADNWLDYPTFSNERRILNGYDYGAFNRYIENTDSSFFWFGSASFHYWWFNHIPHNPGVYEGKLNNWWSYIYDCNRFDGSFIDYPVSGFPITPNRYAVTEEVGTESSSPDLWMFWHSATYNGQRADISIVDKNTYPNFVKKGQYALKTYVQIESNSREGQNDLIYPRYRNANWSFTENEAIYFSVKLDHLHLIQGTNPIVRICTNGNNRIEYVPIKNAKYVNLFKNPENGVKIENGWYNFTIPIKGNEFWQKNLIAYIDPSLDENQQLAEKEAIFQNILSHVNYLEISIECDGNKGEAFYYYLDDLRVGPYSAPVILENITVNPDATSVILHWTPYTGSPAVNTYKVKRNGIDVGSTAGKYGYFTDVNLRPNTNYQYTIEGLTSDGNVACKSLPFSVTTSSSTEIRTDYTVLAVVYDPQGTMQNQLPRIRNYLQYRIDLLRNTSHNSVNIHVYGNDITVLHEYPPTIIKYSIDYQKVATKNYPELNNQSFIDLVESYEIDMVWILHFPQNYNFHNYLLFGNRDLFRQSGESVKVPCSRSFFIHNCVPDLYSLNAAASHIDYVMTNMGKANPLAWQCIKDYFVLSTNINENTSYKLRLHLIEIFKLTDEWAGRDNYASKDNANCGTGLYIPGTIRKSDYYRSTSISDSLSWSRYVDCYADDWLNYPNFSWSGRKINGYEHGAFNHYPLGENQYSFRFGEASYHNWWLNHIPNNPGVYLGMLNNWWPYIFDLNRFTGAYVDYEVTGFPEIPLNYSVVNKEYGTESFNADDWSFWHSTSWRGQRADLSIVQKSSAAVKVMSGNQSIKVDITMDIPEQNHKTGRNDLIYPRFKNAHWSFSENHILTVSIKPESSEVITGTNPIIRLCTNGNNRIEYVPVNNGLYTNLFNNPAYKNETGWYTFSIPLAGNVQWQRNLVAYINPDLSPEAQESEKSETIAGILSDVNYAEISIQLKDTRENTFTFYLDNFTIDGKAVAAIIPGELVFTYSGKPVSPEFTTLPAGLGTKVLYNGLPEAPVDAGNYELSIEVVDPAYYGEFTGTLVIEKAMLSVKAQDEIRRMKEDNPEFSIIYEGFAEGENEGVLDVKPIATCDANWFSTPGTYVITVSGGDDDNYNFTYISGKLTITPVSGTGMAHKHQHKHKHQLHPNPVDKWLYIECPETGPIHIQILSSWGKKIIEVHNASRQINVQKLQPGIYIIVIDGNQYKFIKR
ncbi:MAG: T9SS type A sorting domain-containing protein [Cyclobacteriaceae bacterium]|nr:T9SS type A sorting domain-containing protein [Cyclobacteriaceae bacterium]